MFKNFLLGAITIFPRAIIRGQGYVANQLAQRGYQTLATASRSKLTTFCAMGGILGFPMYQLGYFNIPVVAAAEKDPLYGTPGTKTERTFIAVKPDGTQRGLVGEVISRFERKGYKLVAIKILKPTKEMAQKHYADLKDKPFFSGLVDFFSSGAIVAMVWEGKGVIKGGRVLVGATNPADSLPGSIRGDLCIEIGRNAIHGSDSPASAKDEITLWFTDPEVCNWGKNVDAWVYEK